MPPIRGGGIRLKSFNILSIRLKNFPFSKLNNLIIEENYFFLAYTLTQLIDRNLLSITNNNKKNKTNVESDYDYASALDM